MGMEQTSSQLLEWECEETWMAMGITHIPMGYISHQRLQCIVAEFGSPGVNGRNNTLIQQTVCCFCTAICRDNNWTV